MLMIGCSYGQGLLPNVTSQVTRGRYWHNKLRFGPGLSTDDVVEAKMFRPDTSWRHPWRKMRGGVFWSQARDHDLTGTDWYYSESCTSDQEAEALSYARVLGDLPYDFLTLGKFGLLFRMIAKDKEPKWSRKRVVCSEYVLKITQFVQLPILTRTTPFRCFPHQFMDAEDLKWWPGNIQPVEE